MDANLKTLYNILYSIMQGKKIIFYVKQKLLLLNKQVLKL